MQRWRECLQAMPRLVSALSAGAGLVLLPLLFAVAILPALLRNVDAEWARGAGALPPLQSGVLFGIVLLSVGWIFLLDEHVRIDLFRRHQSAATRAWVDLVGGLVVLVPFCLALIWFGTRFARESYEIGETSEVVLDYPLLWVVKAAIPVGGVLLLLAGLSRMAGDLAEVYRHGRRGRGDRTD